MVHTVCLNYSALLMWHKSSQRQYASQVVWLFSNKTLFTKTGTGPDSVQAESWSIPVGGLFQFKYLLFSFLSPGCSAQEKKKKSPDLKNWTTTNNCSSIFSESQQLFPPFSAVQFSSVTQPCPTLCDPMNRNIPGFPVHHQLPEFTQTHVH